MLQSIKGVYKQGSIELTEIPENIEESQVIVTFLETKPKKTTEQIIYFGMFAGFQQSSEKDFKIAEFTGDSDDNLDWTWAVMKYVVDTHALIWFLEGNSRLGANAKAVLADPTSELILSAIALAEAVWIVDRGRTSIPSVTDLLNAINADPRIMVCPVDKNVIEKSIRLSAITEMHDRLIVATGFVLKDRGEKIILLTCDRNITASGLLPIVWWGKRLFKASVW